MLAGGLGIERGQLSIHNSDEAFIQRISYNYLCPESIEHLHRIIPDHGKGCMVWSGQVWVDIQL